MAARHVQVGDVTGAGRVQKNGSAGGDLLAAVIVGHQHRPGDDQGDGGGEGVGCNAGLRTLPAQIGLQQTSGSGGGQGGAGVVVHRPRGQGDDVAGGQSAGGGGELEGGAGGARAVDVDEHEDGCVEGLSHDLLVFPVSCLRVFARA